MSLEVLALSLILIVFIIIIFLVMLTLFDLLTYGFPCTLEDIVEFIVDKIKSIKELIKR